MKKINILIYTFLTLICIFGIALICLVFFYWHLDPINNSTLFIGVISISLLAIFQPIIFIISYSQKERHRQIESNEWRLQGTEFNYLKEKSDFIKEHPKIFPKEFDVYGGGNNKNPEVATNLENQMIYLVNNHGKSTIDMQNESKIKTFEFLKLIFNFLKMPIFLPKFIMDISNILILNLKDEYHLIDDWRTNDISDFIARKILPKNFVESFKNDERIYLKVFINPKKNEIIFMIPSYIPNVDFIPGNGFSSVFSKKTVQKIPFFYKIESTKLSKFGYNKYSKNKMISSFVNFADSTKYDYLNNELSYSYEESDKINNLPSNNQIKYNKKLLEFTKSLSDFSEYDQPEFLYSKTINYLLSKKSDRWLNMFIFYLGIEEKAKYSNEIFNFQNPPEILVSKSDEKGLKKEQIMFWSIVLKNTRSMYPTGEFQKEVLKKYPKFHANSYKMLSLDYEDFIKKYNKEVIADDYNLVVKSFPVHIYDFEKRRMLELLFYTGKGCFVEEIKKGD